MSIGQLVAISYASGLYYATCEIAPPKRLVVRSSRLLTLTTLTATISTYFLEQSLSTGYFLPLLLAIHLLIQLPLFESEHPSSETSISLKQLHLLNASLALILHWRNIALMDNIGTWSSILRVIGEHPAMSSIGWDIVCCAIIEMAAAGRVEIPLLSAVVSLVGVVGVFRGMES